MRAGWLTRWLFVQLVKTTQRLGVCDQGVDRHPRKPKILEAEGAQGMGRRKGALVGGPM